ncbi:MAG: MBL fold metallo-hydrolase [Chitinophagaceae bacterium]
MIKVESFEFSPITENTYLLSNESGQAIIIDPGCYFSAEEETLKNHIIKNNLKPVQLLNTHCHLDHVFGNKWVAETYGLDLYLHELEEKMLKLAPASGLMYGVSFKNYKGPLHFLKEGDIIKLGEDELKVIFSPGHSPGHVCFYCAAQNFLIGGDVLFYESIGRTDLLFGNHKQLLKNIREKLFILSDETIVYSGHGQPTTIGHEKEFNSFLNE